MTRRTLWRLPAVALLMFTALLALRGSDVAARQDGTPPATPPASSCGTAATPTGGTDHGGMDTGTPIPADEFDRLYIDMMIPHHASIVALAQAALPRLTDERLRTLAENVVAAQTTEIEELRGYRETWYGSPDPLPLAETEMMTVTPDMPAPMGEMMAQMDAATQVARFCAADDADLAFIDLTIPHHLSAVAASETALQRSTHAEARAFAQRVIDAQRREIDELRGIREALYGSTTPEAVG